MDYLCLLSKMPHRKRICRLCFKTCVDNFRAIENNAKETLDILLLKIDLSVSEEPVICTNCAENLGKLFDFKSTCLYTQGYVGPFVNSARLDLKDVYQSKGESENSIGIPKDHTIYGFCILCGFCMDLLTSCSLVSPDSKEEGVILEKMMLEKCLPELDLRDTKNTIICADCRKCLEKYFTFKMNCEIVEERIKKYCEVLGTNGKEPVELNDVLQSTSKNILSEHGDTCNIIKVEETFYDDGENANEVDNKNETFTEMEYQKCNNELQFLKKNTFNWQDDNKVETIKIEENSYEEIKNEVDHKYEHFMETEDRKCLVIDVKADQHDYSSFQDDVVLSQPEATINLSDRQELLMLYQCEFCSYQSKNKHKISRHNLVHKNLLEVTKYQCESCSFQTKYKDHFKKHNNLTHKEPSEITMHRCDSCSYQTKHKTNLKLHSIIHKNRSDLMMYQCDTCSYQTIRKCDLHKHILIHKSPSKIEMYQCELCSFQTKYKDHLKKHNLTHKSTSEITMHQCDSCPYQTKYNSCLTRHNLIHKSPSELTMYPCDSCSFQTKFKYKLKLHSLIHKNPRKNAQSRKKKMSQTKLMT